MAIIASLKTNLFIEHTQFYKKILLFDQYRICSVFPFGISIGFISGY